MAGGLVPKKVAAVEGTQIDDKYRLWYVDNANHTDPTTETQQTHAVAYSGTVQYALRAERMGRARHRPATYQ